MHVYKDYCDICKAEIKDYHCVQLTVDGQHKVEVDLCGTHFDELMPKIEEYIKKTLRKIE